MKALVDETALASYLDEHFGDRAPVDIHRHQAGHSNETFIVRRAGRTFVLRRPPRGPFLPSAHDVGREFTVLAALASTSVRTPAVFLHCTDESVIGAPFYLMEFVDGVVIRSDLPEMFGAPERPRIAEELVDALVELHRVDPESCGLAGFGPPRGYLGRQLRRWRGQLELTLPMTRPLPDLERIGDWLGDNMPESQGTTLVHGDYKLDNVAFARELPVRLVAIFDWEMATLGDPLADLGWMISFWRESGDPAGDVFDRLTGVSTLPGFPPRRELVDRYAAATGYDTGALDWYRVLATWKLAVLLEGSYARHLAGMTDDPFFAEMEHGVPQLAHRALELLSRS
jgi:aminoglycoside phosphotransferase (APT) family kinase protein